MIRTALLWLAGILVAVALLWGLIEGGVALYQILVFFWKHPSQ